MYYVLWNMYNVLCTVKHVQCTMYYVLWKMFFVLIFIISATMFIILFQATTSPPWGETTPPRMAVYTVTIGCAGRDITPYLPLQTEGVWGITPRHHPDHFTGRPAESLWKTGKWVQCSTGTLCWRDCNTESWILEELERAGGGGIRCDKKYR